MNLLYLLSATLLATAVSVYAQNDDIPVESDNQFPPEHLESDGLIEGSGAGVIDEPNNEVTTEIKLAPELESIESIKEHSETVDLSENNEDQSCPKPCVCSIEGATNNYIVDCSGYGLTEFPTPIDPKTTTLNLHNNKLTEIPKEVSALTNLKVLNANNNQIMELVAGSVSELPELVTLNLGNNRLIEYPSDLRNSISLSKLEDLDLGGNDMRTTLSSELFSNFNALRKLTLPSTTSSELVLDICGKLKDTLETVCSESCSVLSFECPEAPQQIEEDLLDAGISVNSAMTEDNSDPSITTEVRNIEAETTENSQVITTTVTTTTESSSKSEANNAQQEVSSLNNVVETPKENQDKINVDEKATDAPPLNNVNLLDEVVPGMIAFDARSMDKESISTGDQNSEGGSTENKEANNPGDTKTETKNENDSTTTEFSLRSAVNSAPQDISSFNTVVETPKEDQDDIKIGAKTSDSNSGGGVSKSVIGLIVAGMIVVVAGITIKKNWSSIKKRFSSTPRPNERPGNNANGTAAEEVPLQDKSPV